MRYLRHLTVPFVALLAGCSSQDRTSPGSSQPEPSTSSKSSSLVVDDFAAVLRNTPWPVQQDAADPCAARLALRGLDRLAADLTGSCGGDTTPLPDPGLIASRFEPASNGWRALAPAPKSRASTAIAARVIVPSTADGWVELEDQDTSQTEPLGLRFRLRGAQPSPVQVDGGNVAFANALGKGHHVLHRASYEGVEDFVLFPQRPAQERITYEVDMSRVAGLRLVANTLEFVDRRGVPRMRVNPPFAVDSAGSRIDLRISVLDCAYDSTTSFSRERDVIAPWPPGTSKNTCTIALDWGDAAGAGRQYPMVVDPAWFTTGSMATARSHFALFDVTRKENLSLPELAYVLAIGGLSGANCTTSVEMYNITAGRWAAAAPLPSARCGPVAVPVEYNSATIMGLPGVIGGAASASSLGTGTSTLYLLWPISAKDYGWKTLAAGTVARVGHAATRLSATTTAAKYLVVGGFGTATVGELTVAGLDTLNPAAAWTNLTSMTSQRGGFALIHRDNASILVAGGAPTLASPPAATNKTEMYSRTANAWTAKAATTAAHFAPDSVFQKSGYLIGGTSTTSSFLEVYDFAANTWSSVAKPSGMSDTGVSLTGVALNTYLAVGGSHAWTLETGVSPGFSDAKNPWESRTRHGATNLRNGTALIVGGLVGSTATATCELWVPGDAPVGSRCDTSGVHGNCATGLACVDGYCCESACTGICKACAQALTGQPNGTCAQVKGGTDPDNDCATGAGGDAFCQPGVCADAPATGCRLLDSVPCTLTICPTPPTGAYTPACKISGTTSSCDYTAGTVDCGNYLCDKGACLTSCTAHTQCDDGYRCVSNKCVLGLAAGAKCSSAAECTSNYCVDGVCCSVECSGTCMACNSSYTNKPNGECHPSAAGTDPRNQCADSGTTCGADGMCDGLGACRQFASGDKPCGATTCLDADTVSGQLCNGVGTCAAQNSDCTGGFRCASSACLTVCTTNGDCVPGYFCDTSDGKCTPTLAAGTTCTAGSQCVSGSCLDNVCCDAPCSGTCKSCNAAYTGVSGGKCAPVEAGKDPHAECAASGTACGADGVCDGTGSCRANAPAGTTCGAAVCVDNDTRIANQECNGSGTCATSSNSVSCIDYKCAAGACLTVCATTADCAPGKYCQTGACVAKQANGIECANADQCLSGACVDGVCCENACSGKCSSCLQAFTGMANGKCGSVLEGEDPRNECPPDSDPCKADGTCDGAGQCRLFALVETPCGAAVCVDNDTKVASKQCDGAGMCSATAQSTSCNGFKCSQGLCLTSCTDGTQGAPGHYCSSLGQCMPLVGNGDPCDANEACQGGHCVDGVCCDSACDKGCQSCSGALNQSGTNGKCGPVKAGEQDPRGLCQEKVDPKDLCGVDGTCDANGNCRLAPKGNACGAASCTNNSSVAKACDGYGACQETVESCSPYACDTAASSCKKICKTDTDCATEAKCEVNTGQCVIIGAECKDDFTVKAPNGMLTDCRPYRCAAGKCRDSCSTTNDCASGFDCSGQTCVKVATGDAGADAETPAQSLTAESDAGCGCRTAGSPRPSGALAMLGLAIASLLRRRL